MKKRETFISRKAYHALLLILCILVPLLGGCSINKDPAAYESTARPRPAATMKPTLGNEPALVYSSVLTEKRVVSIILEGYIDDGAMRSILSMLKSQSTPCAFFLTGMSAYEHPDVVKEIASAGFVIGNYGIDAGKRMEENDVEINIHQFQRGQELLYEAAGVKPTLFRCNSTEYTKEVLQAAAYAGLHAAIKPNAYLNHRSFREKADAALYAQRIVPGSMISVKLGQELDATEFEGIEQIMEKLAVDPSPLLSDHMEKITQGAYANTVNVISWLIEALYSEGYIVLLPEALQAERLTAYDFPIELDEEALQRLDPSAYEKPVTEAPFGTLETETADGTALDGAVFVGDSVMAGLADYVAWRRQTDPGYLGTAQFLTNANFGVVASQRRVTPDSAHPAANGIKMTVQDALKRLGAKTAYIMPGLSDVRNFTQEKFIDHLKLLVYQIEKEIPGIRVCILTLLPGVASRNTEPTNQQILQYNIATIRFCLQYGFPLVDAAFAFRDENGDLPPELCINPDTYGIHLNDAGCERWIDYILSHMPS